MSLNQTSPESPSKNSSQDEEREGKGGRNFGKFYKNSDSNRADNVKLDRANTDSAVEKEEITTKQYNKVKGAIRNFPGKDDADLSDYEDLADAQTDIIQYALKYGKGDGRSVLRDLKREFKQEFGVGDYRVDKIDAWETGMKSVCEYIKKRREELSESEMVNNFELSFQIEWDAKAGVDVVERIKLTEEAIKKAPQDSPYLLNLTQIKSSENANKGPEEYAEDHKVKVVMKLKKRQEQKRDLMTNVMKDRPELGADTNSLNKFKFSEIKESALLQDIFSNVVRVLLTESAESAQKEGFTVGDAREVIWKSFTSLFKGTKSEFKDFCALMASGIVDPAAIFEEFEKSLTSLSDVEELLKGLERKGEIANNNLAFEKAEDRLKEVTSALRKETNRIKSMYGDDLIDYYVTSRYHINKKGETEVEPIISNKTGKWMTVPALQIDESGMEHLYREYSGEFSG